MRIKLILVLLVVVMTGITASSCRSTRVYPKPGVGNSGLPPGQAKKIYGDKSAKKYAPGQQKKH